MPSIEYMHFYHLCVIIVPGNDLVEMRGAKIMGHYWLCLCSCITYINFGRDPGMQVSLLIAPLVSRPRHHL